MLFWSANSLSDYFQKLWIVKSSFRPAALAMFTSSYSPLETFSWSFVSMRKRCLNTSHTLHLENVLLIIIQTTNACAHLFSESKRNLSAARFFPCFTLIFFFTNLLFLPDSNLPMPPARLFLCSLLEPDWCYAVCWISCLLEIFIMKYTVQFNLISPGILNMTVPKINEIFNFHPWISNSVTVTFCRNLFSAVIS